MSTNKKTLTKSGVNNAACYLRIIKDKQKEVSDKIGGTDLQNVDNLHDVLFSQHEQMDRIIYLVQNLLNDAEDL